MGKGKPSRNILWYFIRSKVWKSYQTEVTHSYMYQYKTDMERANLLLSRNTNPKLGKIMDGVRTFDYIYDMYDCVYNAKIAEATKVRIYKELEDLHTWHENMGTINEVV